MQKGSVTRKFRPRSWDETDLGIVDETDGTGDEAGDAVGAVEVLVAELGVVEEAVEARAVAVALGRLQPLAAAAVDALRHVADAPASAGPPPVTSAIIRREAGEILSGT